METLKRSPRQDDKEHDDIEPPFGIDLGIKQDMKEYPRFSYTSGTEPYESTHRDPAVTDFNDTTEDE